MVVTGTSLNDQRFIFWAIQKIKNGEVLRDSGCISYSCLKDLFCKKLAFLGLPAREFGLHSLRAGEQLRQPMLRCRMTVQDTWQMKSGNAKDGYVKDSVESRLEVSKSLGLYLNAYSFLC